MESLIIERPDVLLDVFTIVGNVINEFCSGNTKFVNNKYCEIMNETDATKCVQKIHNLLPYMININLSEKRGREDPRNRFCILFVLKESMVRFLFVWKLTLFSQWNLYIINFMLSSECCQGNW